MKKHFKNYALLWTIIFVAWCAVVFLVRPVIPGYTIIYDSRFWISFAFIVISFVTNLICAFTAFKSDNLEKIFMNLPLVTISRTALIITVIAGSAIMLIPDCPYWIAAVVCALLSLFNVVSIFKASWTAETISDTEEKIKTNTSFIRELTSDVQSLMSRAQDNETKALCKKVYESVRYSDPVSNSNLSQIEDEISTKFNELSLAVDENNAVKAKELSDELVVLIKERNTKYKAFK